MCAEGHYHSVSMPFRRLTTIEEFMRDEWKRTKNFTLCVAASERRAGRALNAKGPGPAAAALQKWTG